MFVQKNDDIAHPSNTDKPSIPLPTITPTPVNLQVAGETGHRTLWVVFVIMLVSSLSIYFMAWRVPANKRLFHILTGLITTFAAISYYAMAVGDGIYLSTDVVNDPKADPLPDLSKHVHREVYWARYVDWTVTTPLLLVDLALLAGLNGANILVAVAADIIMVLTGLFAALNKNARDNSEETSQRWGYFAMGCIAYLVVVYQLAIGGRATVASKDKNTATFFAAIAGFTLVLWTIYPIIWGLADGSYIMDVDQEILAYAVLDVLAKPVFGFWLLFTHDALAQNSFSLEGFWAHGLSNEGAIRVGEDDDGA